MKNFSFVQRLSTKIVWHQIQTDTKIIFSSNMIINARIHHHRFYDSHYNFKKRLKHHIEDRSCWDFFLTEYLQYLESLYLMAPDFESKIQRLVRRGTFPCFTGCSLWKDCRLSMLLTNIPIHNIIKSALLDQARVDICVPSPPPKKKPPKNRDNPNLGGGVVFTY